MPTFSETMTQTVNKRSTIAWAPFSPKHRAYIKNALKVKMSVAEGAVRSGKTIDHCIIAAAYLETCPDKIHLASGSTLPNAKLNIGDCNGFGLEHLFRGRCKWGKYKDNECLRLYTQTGEKVVVFAGGGKADSYKKILGNSYGLWIATEINEHFDSDDARVSFIKVASDRQIAAQKPLRLWDLNPSNPNASIYTEYIDRYQDPAIAEAMGGYQYQHFTIADNLSVSEERRRQIEAEYTVGTIRYRRNILGERCIAEGLVYPCFCDNEDDYYITAEEVPEDIRSICVGQDFGGNKSKHAFCASALSRDGRTLYVLKSAEDRATGTNVDYICNSLESFINAVQGIYNRPVTRVYADSAEQAIINTERGRFPGMIQNSIKNEVIDRIRAVDLLLATKRIKIVKSENESLISALRSATYDPKSAKDSRLDIPGVTNICPLDAFEYSWEAYIRDLTRDVYRR